MHYTWPFLRSAWSAVVLVYLALAMVGAWRLRSVAKERNHSILIVMAFLLVIRFAVRYAFGGLAYRFAMTIFGIAAGIAALIVAKMLITQKPTDANGADEREKAPIQSLKLS